MFENEVHALMELDHPHIVKLVEYFDDGESVVLIFELCEGTKTHVGSKFELRYDHFLEQFYVESELHLNGLTDIHTLAVGEIKNDAFPLFGDKNSGTDFFNDFWWVLHI